MSERCRVEPAPVSFNLTAAAFFFAPIFRRQKRKPKTETYNRIFKVHPPKIKLLPVYLTAHFFRSPLPEVVSAAIQFISRGILKFNRIL